MTAPMTPPDTAAQVAQEIELPLGDAVVTWSDPALQIMPPRPGKVIDATLAVMDAAQIGDRFYSAAQVRELLSAALRAQPDPAAPHGLEAVRREGFAAGIEAAAKRAERTVERYYEGMSSVHVGLSYVQVPEWDNGRRIASAIREISPSRLPADAEGERRGWQSVLDEVAAERRRQVSIEGWSAEHDDEHGDNSLAAVAACYAGHAWMLKSERTEDGVGDTGRGIRKTYLVPFGWPSTWHAGWWKPKDRRRDLVRAGALIIAEIERLDRALPPPPEPSGEQPAVPDEGGAV